MNKKQDNTIDREFYTVLSDGKFHRAVAQGTEGAVERKYEDKDGIEQVKYELIYTELEGNITNMEFVDGDFGTNLHIELDQEGILSFGTSSSFGEDLMKKIPAIDFTKPVTFAPYSFEDAGKSRKGVTVIQDGDVKIKSYYRQDDKDVNGMPSPEGDTSKYKSDDWKLYFLQVRKFLTKEITTIIEAKFHKKDTVVETPTQAVAEEEIDIDGAF